MAADLSQHAYLLRTDGTYRDAFVAETIVKMARLMEALAVRSGLSFDAEGNVLGLTEEEQALLAGFVPAVNVNTVQEARPRHLYPIDQEVPNLDPYAATADPNAPVPAHEEVDPSIGEGDLSTYLSNRSADAEQEAPVDPNADVEEMSDEQALAFEQGGFFPEADDSDSDDEPDAKDVAKAAAAPKATAAKAASTDDDD